jgi:hydroxymethylglutaryl-CoA lyase
MSNDLNGFGKKRAFVKVQVVEVGPRDGLQNDHVSFSTDQKVEFVRRVAQSGIRRVEVCSFVNPKRVPQMADAEAVADAVAALPERVEAIGLVLNARGWDRAAKTSLDEVNVVVVSTDTFAKKNSGIDTEGTVRVAEEVTALAKADGRRVSATLAASFGCPYEGEVPLGRTLELAARCAAVGVDELVLADTIGAAVPADVTRRFEAVRAAVGDEMTLRGHFHNTRNMGYANAWAAVEAGVAVLDASLGGIGGCPFAPRATGNIATEDLVFMLARSGVETGVDLDRLFDVSAWLEDRLGRTVPALLPKAGPFPNALE